MASKKRTVGGDVGGRGRSGSKKVLPSQEQDRTEVEPEGNNEVRTDEIGLQGFNQNWEDIAMNVMLSALSASVTQGMLVGINRENVSTMGLSYFVRLYDSLMPDYSVQHRREKMMEVIDMYFLACSDQKVSS